MSIQRYQTTFTTVPNYGPHYPVLATIGSRQINQGGTVAFTATATDQDGNAINYMYDVIEDKTPPTGLSLPGTTQSFSWSNTTIPGNYWLRFTATDAVDDLSDSEDVVFTVGNVNRPPTLDPIGDRVVQNNQQIQFTVTATDPENNGLTFSAEAQFDHNWPTGAVFTPATQTFTFTPSETNPRTYFLKFIVTDNGSPQESDYEYVELTVITD